ncbi:lipoate--protein ligase [Pseudoflavonifractor sp. MSJ-37]|uniref:lipoate--protein ligase n=1 Tax=Pseudoflavonifractor sp. MSJ-37 TaxID=2841531 RepID=UPI001C0FF81F|nr:lipoate--protein ligase [Pseudoflavonifractor sp. MSJ-37]MBU5436228.1 lipoate--protein ligase [Pseudoflavonifractor sp. MSJ-37]
MYYIESTSSDPHFNLALEQYVFDKLDQSQDYFMLWQNDNAIIVGKHQNTIGEINAPYVKEHDIQVVRRLSGGGAVYHDMGNINFTFIADTGGVSKFDFSTFCRPVVKALRSIGVPAEINGRNDMTVDGKKFSGNSQYMKHGRVMHHGTLMFDSDLEVVSQALAVSRDKIESKGLKSVRSRVTNIKPYVKEDISTQDFLRILREFMFEEYGLKPYPLTDADIEAVKALQHEVYDKWEWNYGRSPACQIRKERRVEGCGKLEVHMDVARGGEITALSFFGDYFGNGDSHELAQRLIGRPLEESALRAALEGVEIGDYFNKLDKDTFLSILLQ